MSFEAHLTSGQTTVSYCWIIRRRDGTNMGFTDHDEDILLETILCVSSTGITTTKFAQYLGLNADDLEIEGIIDNELITADDIRAGLYDNAAVELYIVNWSDPTEFILLGFGTFGNLAETDDGTFVTEFRSQSNLLAQTEGRTFQRTCDTKLGSTRCGVDLDDPRFSKTVTVVSLFDQTLTVSDISEFEQGWFSLGKIITVDEGYELKVRYHTGNVIYLWERPQFPVDFGAGLILQAGCKQDAETCRLKFENIVNFQGFNLIPGMDRLTEYPVRGAADYNGGSLFK